MPSFKLLILFSSFFILFSLSSLAEEIQDSSKKSPSEISVDSSKNDFKKRIRSKEIKWHLKESPHFKVYHESSWSPASIIVELEKIHNMMKMHISMFSPWMMIEKGKVYIYSSKKTYLSGEFKPPAWSKGLAFIKKKTIVVYDLGDISKLRAIISHELTHLYFEGFFGEKFKHPPQWLNEGIAVLMEDKSYGNGPWHNALRYVPKERYISFSDFFDIEVNQLDSKQQIGDWYLQAFGIVKYLFDPGKRIQFKNFCDLTRSGKNVEEALWASYRIRSLGGFEKSWLKWLETYRTKDEKTSGFPSASFDFIPLKTTPSEFKKFK
ncbi:MAG: hypothetical protein L6420_08065 [Elusimicrobia bacterium]|nr:hypothetical protein [Elusimicrobiota bacterium]